MRSIRTASSSSRWLIAVAAVVLILIVGSVLVGVLTSDNDERDYEERSPEAALAMYLRAIADDDVDTAYSLIAPDVRETCSLSQFVRARKDGFSASISDTQQVDGNVLIRTEITEFDYQPLFEQRKYSFSHGFLMVQVDGEWKLTRPIWPFGGCPEPPPKVEPE